MDAAAGRTGGVVMTRTERNEHILDAWANSATTGALAARFNVSGPTISTVIRNARFRGDPRVERNVRTARAPMQVRPASVASIFGPVVG